MACLPTNIIREVDHSCGYSKGGVTRIWVSLLEGDGVDVFGWLDGYTGYSFVDNKVTGVRHLDMDALDLTSDAVAALGADASTFVEIKFNDRDGETKFNEVLERGEDGYGFYEISIDVEIPNMDYISNPAVAQITDGAVDFVAIVETNALGDRFRRTYHFLGKENGLRFIRVEGDTGASLQDRNVYKLRMSGYEKELSYLVKTDPNFSFDGLPAAIAVIDPSSDVSTTSLIEADFVADKTSIYEGDKVSFTDLSTGSPNSWNWNFGDTNTSTAQNAANIYASAGSYDVSLTASNDFTIDTETKTSYISVASKSFINIGTWAEPTLNSLVSVSSSPLQRTELNLVGDAIYGDQTNPSNLSATLSPSGGSGVASLWTPSPSNISNFTSLGDCVTVDMDAVSSAVSGQVSIYADYATGSISMLNSSFGAFTAKKDFDGTLDFDSWSSSASYGNIDIVGGSFTSTLGNWPTLTPTLYIVELRPDELVLSSHVDDLLIKLAEATWTTTGLGKKVVILGLSEPPSAASAGAISQLNSYGVTVTTN